MLKHTDRYSHVIWDWNGTILNDIDAALKSINSLLSEHGLPLIDKQYYHKFFGFPVRHFYENLGFDFSNVCFAKLCDQFMNEYDKNRPSHTRLHTGIEETLATIKTKKTQSILSAASQLHLDQITKDFSIDHHFDHIYGIDNNQAGTKVNRGRELVTTSGICPTNTLLIGDTDHDYEVGEALGIDVLLVADGHQSFERLSKKPCTVLQTRYHS